MSRSRLRALRLLAVCLVAALGTSAGLHAQQVTVHGTVVNNSTNQPIPDALVAVQGTTLGTSTNANGEFALTVPSADVTLVVSRLGFIRREVPLNGRVELVIPLTVTAVSLDSMVVVGYGTQRRSDVTGAVASVSPERLENTPSGNFAEALEGAVPGVSITTTGAGAEPDLSFIIRGRNSIKASNDPLIVVDGIPYEGGLSEINQRDIASIQILKDASAAAIYGSRGSNGVVLITTKRGGVGKTRISYNAYAGVQRIAHMPRLMTGPEFAQFKCDRLNNGEDCESVLTPTELANWQAGRSTDWVDLATRTGFQQQHSLSLSGGTEDTKYYIAGSIFDVQGIAKNDDFRRYALRLNLGQTVRPWLEIGTNTQMSITDRGGMPASFSDAFFMNPLTNPYEADGRTLTVYPWPEDLFFANPLEGTLVKDDDESRRIFTSNYLQLDLPYVDGLSYRVNAGIDFADRDQGRYYGRNTATGLGVLGSATVTNSNRFDWTVENILRYTRAFGKHGVDITALYSRQKNSLETERLHSEGFPNDVLTYHQANVAKLVEPSDNVTKSAMVSQMGRLNYNYADRYLVTLTARRDGYSGFGQNHKYGTFPSVAVAWNASNESFWPSEKTVNTLKLRASYGKNGNQAIAPYQTLGQLDDESYLDGETTAPGYIPATLGNPDLKWETTTSLDVGADFALFGDRIQGSVDYYLARTSDLLLDRAISPVHGITSVTENIGKTENKGFELQLSTLNVDTKDFSWSTNFNISLNRNKIVDLYGNGEDDILNGWFLGHPIDVNYGYLFDGIWQEGDDIANSAQPTAQPGDVRIRDVNGDGKIDPQDRTFIGSLQPSYIAGLSNTIRYKGFTLSAFLHTVQGVKRSNPLLASNQVFTEVRRNTLKLDYWTPENPINTYPANREEANALAVAFYEDASYIRLKNVTLSYDLPTSLTTRMGVEGLRLYVTGENLWTQTDWHGLDPELSGQRAVPLAKVFTGGINVDF